MVSPYYYGQYRWDNYIQDLERNQEASIDLQQQHAQQNEELTRGMQQHLGELHEQTDELRTINKTLQMGFEEMRAEFNWGFTLMVERLDQQIDLLSDIAARLDSIHKTLQSPLMTQARELFLIGQDRFKKGLWDKALEAYLMAEQKNDVDFPLQFQIGKLYLYGNNGEFSLIDVAKADTHLSFAVRIAEAEKDSLPDWSRNCGEAHFHVAVAAYLRGEQEEKAGDKQKKQECLGRSISHLAKAVQQWPNFTESVYLQAKCRSLLGQKKEALDALTNLSDRDRRYYSKTLRDADFDGFRAEVEEVFKRTLTQPGNLAKSAQDLLSKAMGVLEWTRRSKPDQLTDKWKIDSIETCLVKGRAVVDTLDADVESLHAEFMKALHDLDEIVTRILAGRVEAIRTRLGELEIRRTGALRSVEYLRGEMKKTEGSKGVGWVMFAGAFLGSAYVTATLEQLPVARDLIRSFIRTYTPVYVVGVLVLSIFGYWSGIKISASNNNAPKRRQVEENLRVARACEPLIGQLREDVKSAEAEFQPYLQWRLSNRIV